MNRFETLGMSLVIAVTLALPQFAEAHASLKKSIPAAGATVEASPKDISITFNEKVEESFSTITVKDAAGKDVAGPKCHVDATNGTTLHLDAPTLTAGAYTVLWVAVGHDGHRRTGEFKFTVK